MSNIIEIKIGEQIVYFEESSKTLYGSTKVGVKDVGKQAIQSFQTALDTIRAVTSATVQHIKTFENDNVPNEFQLQFGLNISGEYGAVVAKATAEAQITVTMTYKSSESK